MRPGRAPMALRNPISRIRSVTDTNMMFITPMPPTSNAMIAMPASITVIVLSTDDAALSSDCWVAIEKSASSGRRDPVQIQQRGVCLLVRGRQRRLAGRLEDDLAHRVRASLRRRGFC